MVKIFNFLKKYWPLIGLIIISGFTCHFLLKELKKVPMPEISEFPVPPQKVHCLILDKEYCEKGELVYDKDNNFVGLGFSLPDKTKIYSPFNGLIDNAYGEVVFPNQLHTGFSIRELAREEFIEFTVVGGLKTVIKPETPVFPEEPERLVYEPVEKREAVAEIDKGTGFKIIPPSTPEEPIVERDYDILINFWQLNQETGRLEKNKDKLQKFFNYVK